MLHRHSRFRCLVLFFALSLGTADYTLSHSGIPAAATQVHLYQSGHMPYLGDESRRALARDLRAFLVGAPTPVTAKAIAH